MRVIIATTLVVLAASSIALTQPVPNPNSRAHIVRVVDGDTIQYGTKIVRLVGIDAGEIIKGHYKCDQELQDGLKAKARMFDLLSPPHRVTMRWRKGHDAHGRSLGVVYSDKEDAGRILVSEGLAVVWSGKSPKPNHCGGSPTNAKGYYDG